MANLDTVKVLYATKDYSAAWVAYQEAWVQDPDNAEVHLWGARSAKAKGDIYGARWAIDQAHEACPLGAIGGQVRFMRGLVLREVGDIEESIQSFEACIQGMWEYPELGPMMLGPALYNYALALRQAKRNLDAIDAYRRATDELRNEKSLIHLCMTLHNLAWVACISLLTDVAREALDESEGLCTTEVLRWHQAIGQAHLDAIVDDQTAHRRAVVTCDELISSGAPDEIKSHACWLVGRSALTLNQLDSAESLALQAIHHGARARNDNRCLADAAELLALIRTERILSPPGLL
jgi:tetratricopeptide (TPR) repeat protein